MVKAPRELAAGSQRIRDLSRARTMLLAIACLFASAAAGPIITYDQRQDGETNGVLKISNIVFLVAIPSKIPPNIFDFFSKSEKGLSDEHDGIQDRADVRVMEAFVEPSKPYQVEIVSDEKSAGSGVAAEVVIAGRRRLGTEVPDAEQDELKLLGATENCGPDRVRDSVTLMCKDVQTVKILSEPEVQKQADEKVVILELLPAPAPEVVPS